MSLTAVEQSVVDLLAGSSKALLESLAEYVAIPTGRGHRPGLEQFRGLLEERLTKLNAEISDIPGEPRPAWVWPKVEAAWIPPVLVARSQHGRKANGPRVLIVGHLDTVHDPAGSFRELTLNPDGKTATGPGVVDMKGGIVISLAALEALAQAGIAVQWTAAFNSDEETGSFHSAKALRSLAREHDVGIVVEPGLAGGAIAIERMGSVQFMIEVHGRTAHVGRDFKQGVSAVTKLGALIADVGGWSDVDNGLIVNIGPLQGAPVTNAVPDYAACWGNARFVKPETGQRFIERLKTLSTAEDAMPRVRVYSIDNRPAKPMTQGVADLASLITDAGNDLGQTIPQISTGGVCDGNLLQDEGLPTTDTLGVRGGNLHRPDEFIEVDSLVERAQLLAVVLARLAGRQV